MDDMDTRTHIITIRDVVSMFSNIRTRVFCLWEYTSDTSMGMMVCVNMWYSTDTHATGESVSRQKLRETLSEGEGESE